MASGDDDLDFDSLMREEGARPLGKPPQASAPRRAPSPGPRLPAPRPLAPHRAPAPPAPPPPAPPPAALTEAARALSTLRAERDALRAELEAARAELEAARAEAADATRERDAFDNERRALALRLSKAPAVTVAAARPTSVDEALAAAGLAPDEHVAALVALLQRPDAAGLITLLEASRADALAAWLDARLSLVCGAPACVPSAGAEVFRVSPARCEFCGGSDVRRAAKRFFAACAAAGISRVRVVGGSPTYGRVLRELAADEPVDLKTVCGTARRTQKEARADQKHADLVILWGATLLDHATSDLYDRRRSRVLTVAHRGIGRMLELAATSL